MGFGGPSALRTMLQHLSPPHVSTFPRPEVLCPENMGGKRSEAASVTVHSKNDGCWGGNSNHRDEDLGFYS